MIHWVEFWKRVKILVGEISDRSAKGRHDVWSGRHCLGSRVQRTDFIGRASSPEPYFMHTLCHRCHIYLTREWRCPTFGFVNFPRGRLTANAVCRAKLDVTFVDLRIRVPLDFRAEIRHWLSMPSIPKTSRSAPHVCSTNNVC